MKKIFILGAMSSLLMANISFDGRIMYFDRDFDNSTPNATALTVGGVLNVESPEYYGFIAGASYFGSYLVEDITDREGTAGSSMTAYDLSNISFLGEVYIQYKMDDVIVKIGRQRLATPLINDHDLRALPSSYEAAIIKYIGFKNTHLEAGYITEYTGFVSKGNGFDDYNTKWGSDGLAYVYGKTKIKDITLNAQFVDALSDTDDEGATITIANYYYADVHIPVEFGTRSYLKGQFGGNKYNEHANSFMYGLKAVTDIYGVTTAVVFDHIIDNNYRAVEAGPMYTDWQQGYARYEPSKAVGAQLWKQLTPKWYGKVGAVQVLAADDISADDYTEYNVDTSYAFTEHNKLRLRFSFEDQTSSSTRDDRSDFRVIYYHSF